jgi:predicted ferric reductase
MKPIQYTLWGFLALLTAAWLLAEARLPEPTWFAMRGPIVQLSGIVAAGAMSFAVLLALRPAWLEARLNGLDKMYRLHKWLGIVALAAATLHWWWAQGSKWMVAWGWLARPARGPRPAAGNTFAALLDAWRGPAEHAGEWAFYGAAVLLALAKRFPYRKFMRTHSWLAAFYLVFAWHSLVLMRRDYWAKPVGWLVAALLIAGTVSAALILFGRVGRGRKIKGRVAALAHDAQDPLLRLELELEPGWPGHAAGQFAFVTTDPKEGAHPYTIVSAWDASRRQLAFVIKALGDHTRELPRTLRVGQTVTVEGPYGRFTFEGPEKRQIWIGAGIGITPFLARLEELRARQDGENGGGVPIDLFHPVADAAKEALDKLAAGARAAGVTPHILISPRDGLLTGDDIRAAVPGWKDAGIWFCGPADFGRALRADFIAQGFPPDAFRQELFEMR